MREEGAGKEDHAPEVQVSRKNKEVLVPKKETHLHFPTCQRFCKVGMKRF